MITSQELSINQKEELRVPSTDFPVSVSSQSRQASGQLFKAVEISQQIQPSEGSAQTKSTDFSSLSSFNEKTHDIMPMQNKDQFDVFQASRVSDESEAGTPSLPKWLVIQENPLVFQKKGRQARKKKETKVKKNAPQKKKNVNFKKTKSKTQKGSAKNKRTPQSPYKNSYKAIYCETLNNIEVFCKISPEKYAQICEEKAKSEEEWIEDTQSKPILTEAMGRELVETQDYFIKWLVDNEAKLVLAIGDKKFVKFLSLKGLIEESDGLINEEVCRKYFEEWKGRSLKNLKGEDEILNWLLIVAFSLVWLPEEAKSQFLALQKDTVALFSWIISSNTHAKSKLLLFDSNHRQRIRKFIETTFSTLFKSAWNQFPARRNWLTKVHDLLYEKELPSTINAAKDDPNILKQVQNHLSNAQDTSGSTACSESFSPAEEQQTASIRYGMDFLDCKLIEESKLEFDYNGHILTNQKNLESLEFDPYQEEKDFYARMSAFEAKFDKDWNKNAKKNFEIDWFTNSQEEQLRSAWKLQQALNGKRLGFLCGGYEVEPTKKAKTV